MIVRRSIGLFILLNLFLLCKAGIEFGFPEEEVEPKSASEKSVIFFYYFLLKCVHTCESLISMFFVLISLGNSQWINSLISKNK